VLFDIGKIHRLRNALMLVKITGVDRKISVIGNATQVAFEMTHIHRIKTQERGEQPPVGLGQPLTKLVALL